MPIFNETLRKITKNLFLNGTYNKKKLNLR